MSQGNVKWFSSEKGFGFIAPDDGGDDVFVHRSNVQGLEWGDALQEGDHVEFEVEETPKGLNARNVEIL